MITAIIQARVGSSRLPNKVFADLAGKPLIWHVVDRLRFSLRLENIVLATTTNPKDDILATWARENRVPVFRGSEEDVLARYYEAAKAHDATTIVRITADDPFKDPNMIDEVIHMWKNLGLDFAYNNKPPSFPEGLDTEVFSFSALERAHHEARDPFEREHVTQYFYRHPELFKQANLAHELDLSYLRWTIDTAQDLEMARRVYSSLFEEGKLFALREILDLLAAEPEIAQLNVQVPRSALYSARLQ